mgnify:CR=1 FL=1
MWTRVSDIDRMFGTMDLLRSRMNRLFNDYDRSYGETYGGKLPTGPLAQISTTMEISLKYGPRFPVSLKKI